MKRNCFSLLIFFIGTTSALIFLPWCSGLYTEACSFEFYQPIWQSKPVPTQFINFDKTKSTPGPESRIGWHIVAEEIFFVFLVALFISMKQNKSK